MVSWESVLLAHGLLLLGVVAALILLRKVAPEAFTKVPSRVPVLYPVVLSIGGVFAGLTTYELPVEKAVAGLVVGVFASYVYKLAKPLLKRAFKKTFELDGAEVDKALED